MEDVERLLKGTVEELDRLLDAKHVLAEPIETDGAGIGCDHARTGIGQERALPGSWGQHQDDFTRGDLQ